MTLLFDYCSDLHVDVWHGQTRLLSATGPQYWIELDGQPYFQHIDWKWHQNPGSEVLVIAGDISNDIQQTIAVVRDAARVYKWVVFVEGNHDHYQHELLGNIESNRKSLAEELSDLSNVVHLDGERDLQLGSTLFIGAMGWYDWQCFVDRGISAELARDSWIRGNADSQYIDFGGFKSPAIAAMHDSEALRSKVIKAQDDDSISDIVVVTHSSPRADIMLWIDGNDDWNNLTPSYVNSGMSRVVEADVKSKIRHWVYGHTHYRQVLDLDGIRYSNGARGLPRETGPWIMGQQKVG